MSKMEFFPGDLPRIEVDVVRSTLVLAKVVSFLPEGQISAAVTVGNGPARDLKQLPNPVGAR